MCGICGYNGKHPSIDLILNMLEKLEPIVGGKGTGIAFKFNNQIHIAKCKGNLADFREKLNQDKYSVRIKNEGCLGIAHTRHPSSSFFLNEDKFSHPLLDCSRAIALVHNGTLDSDKFYIDHKQIFKGHNFATKKEGKILDSELLVHMIEHFHGKGNSLLEAIKITFSIAKAYGELKGFGMFAVISNKDEKIYIAYGPHDENSLEIRKTNKGYCFYTINEELKQDIVENTEKVAGWDPTNRDQIAVIEKDRVTFQKSENGEEKMNEYYNPYDFTNPVKDPKLFAGRKEELKEIEYYLELSRSKSPKYVHLALIGERASGKTSLLNMIEFMANEKSFLAVKIPLNKETSSSDVLFFKEVFDGIMTKGAEKGMYGGIKGKIYRTFRRMVDTLDISAEIPILFGTAYVGLKKKEHEAGIPQHVLIHDLQEISSEAKKNGIRTIVLLFDECNLLAQNEVLLQKIRNAFMEVEGYILAFSGTEKMFPAISDVFSPIPRFFKRINVENFKTFEETKECILKPLGEDERRAVDMRSVGEIHWLTGGLPYEVNLIAHFMYRRCKETKSPALGLSIQVLDDVLKELEMSRKEERHEIANKIRQCGLQQLRVLISLIEFPKVPHEWLVKYILLDNLYSITLQKAVDESETISFVIDQLKATGIIEESDEKQLSFKGDQFDFLYLKYFAISKGVKDFFVGVGDDPLLNLHMKLERVLLKDFSEYEIQTKFDKREYMKEIGRAGQKVIYGVKVIVPPGEQKILEFTLNELQRKFYLGAPLSIRYRVNVNYMTEGFVTQATFKKKEDEKKFSSLLVQLVEKLKAAGLDTLLKDEIAWNIEGNQLLKEKKYTEAIESFNEAIKINPVFELPWINKGIAFFELKDYEKAIECFSKATEIHPRFAAAWEWHGKALINLKRNKEALASLNKAIECEPENWSAWDNRGRALFNLKNDDEATRCFDKVLKVYPDNVEVLNLKALALARLGRLDEALVCYSTLIEKDPNNENHLINRGIALFEDKRFSEALSDLDKALQINPKMTEAWVVKSLALSGMGKYEQASLCCDKILEIEPNNATAFYNKACFESLRGNVETAIDFLRKAIKIDKRFIEAAKEERDFDNIRNDERFVKLIGTDS